MEHVTKEGLSVEKDPQKRALGPLGLWVDTQGTVLGKRLQGPAKSHCRVRGSWSWHLGAFQPVIVVQPCPRPRALTQPRLQKGST